MTDRMCAWRSPAMPLFERPPIVFVRAGDPTGRAGKFE